MKKSRLLVLLLALVMVVGLSGCGNIKITIEKDDGGNKDTTMVTPEVQAPVAPPDVTEPTVTPDVQEPAPTPPADDSNIQQAEVPTVESNTDNNLTVPVAPVEPTSPIDLTISDDWRDLEFVLDGVKYKINETSYADLKEAGWTFDLKDYGYENGYIMNPRDKTYGTIELKNEKYGDKYDAFSITVGFINNDTVAKDITECDIWSISMDSRYGFRLRESYSDMTIAKGVTFGTSEADLLAAFGTPEDTYENTEKGYKAYTWRSDFSEYLYINVYADGGVSSFKLQQY